MKKDKFYKLSTIVKRLGKSMEDFLLNLDIKYSITIFMERNAILIEDQNGTHVGMFLCIENEEGGLDIRILSFIPNELVENSYFTFARIFSFDSFIWNKNADIARLAFETFLNFMYVREFAEGAISEGYMENENNCPILRLPLEITQHDCLQFYADTKKVQKTNQSRHRHI